MTQDEKKEVKRVCGKNFKTEDVPAYIREREEKELQKMEETQMNQVD